MNGSLLIPCGACNAINRVKVEKMGEGPKCAKCKARLELGKPVNVNEGPFEKVVLNSGVPVLVDFWAPWCGPCRSMAPVLDRFAMKNAGAVLVAKLNTDENPALSSRFGIQGVPTLILFQEGREVGRQVGAVPEQAITNMVREAKAS